MRRCSGEALERRPSSGRSNNAISLKAVPLISRSRGAIDDGRYCLRCKQEGGGVSSGEIQREGAKESVFNVSELNQGMRLWGLAKVLVPLLRASQPVLMMPPEGTTELRRILWSLKVTLVWVQTGRS